MFTGCLCQRQTGWRIILEWAEMWVEGVKGLHITVSVCHCSSPAGTLTALGFFSRRALIPWLRWCFQMFKISSFFEWLKLLWWAGKAVHSWLHISVFLHINSSLHVLTVNGSSGAHFPHIRSYFFIQNVWKRSYLQPGSTDPLGLCDVLRIWEQNILNLSS